ncbi:MAG: hypothetical protein KIH63_005755 [Candidatus Saccharibacteria bacterium]|nr:hypothetical protein [Candidatus Saccharibacteria bacterium]
MRRKLLVGVLILIVLGLIYFVPTQSDSVNTGQGFGSPPSSTTTTEQTSEPSTDTAAPPAATQPPVTSDSPKKVDTTQLNDVDASLNDDLDSEVDGSF